MALLAASMYSEPQLYSRQAPLVPTRAVAQVRTKDDRFFD